MSFKQAVKDLETELNIKLPQDYVDFLEIDYGKKESRKCNQDFLSIEDIKTGETVLKRYRLFRNMSDQEFSLEDYKKQLIISDVEGCAVVMDMRKNGNGVYLLFPSQREIRVVVTQDSNGNDVSNVMELGDELKRKFKDFTDFYNFYILC